MKNKAVISIILFWVMNVVGLHSQNTLKIHNFFEEALNIQVSYVIDLPFKSKYKKIEIKRSEVPAFQAYILKPREPKIEMSLSISESDTNYDLKLIEEAGGVLQKSDRKVRIIKMYGNSTDTKVNYTAYLLKAVKINDLTYCLTLIVSGEASILDTSIDEILNAFDESAIVY
jgi:hypothetical protein